MTWKLDVSSLDALIELERFESSVRRGENLLGLSNLAYIALSYATLKLLGFDTTEQSISGMLLESIEPLVDFHIGDWWSEENVTAFCKRNAYDEIKTTTEVNYCRQFAPENRAQLTIDREMIGCSVLACLFTSSEHELRTICETYSPDMEPEYYGGSIDELFQRSLLLVAARAAGLPAEGYEANIAAISERPLKYSTSFRDLVDAVFNDDQASFDQILPVSLSLRMKRWEYMNILDHLSLEHSILIEIAEHRGMVVPALSKKRRECILRKCDVAES